MANSKLTSTPLDNQTPSYNFSRLDNNNEDLSIFSVAYQNAAQIIPSLTPPPLPPRDISDNLSISGSLVGEPTISLSQPNSPIRTKTLTRKPPPPKSPLLHAFSKSRYKRFIVHNKSRFVMNVDIYSLHISCPTCIHL